MWLAVDFGHPDNILAKTLDFLYELGLQQCQVLQKTLDDSSKKT